jgi:hypothetical protein
VCEECISRLSKYSVIYSDFLTEVCLSALHGQTIFFREGFDDNYCNVVKFLEIRGYVVSSDLYHEYIGVKSNLNRISVKNGRFCWCD